MGRTIRETYAAVMKRPACIHGTNLRAGSLLFLTLQTAVMAIATQAMSVMAKRIIATMRRINPKRVAEPRLTSEYGLS